MRSARRNDHDVAAAQATLFFADLGREFPVNEQNYLIALRVDIGSLLLAPPGSSVITAVWLRSVVCSTSKNSVLC